MKLNCENSQTLVPPYLDGQLSEAQAAPLRAHLIECPSCREVAKQGKNLKRWFAEGASCEVPRGFAARIARRAFQGDRGLPPLVEPELALTPWNSQGSPLSGSERTDASSRGALLPFLLTLSSVAAALLLVFALGIQKQSLPESNTLDASDPRPPWERRAIEFESTPGEAADDVQELDEGDLEPDLEQDADGSDPR